MRASVVEINGDRYNAVTGKIISQAKPHYKRVIDGFVKSPSNSPSDQPAKPRREAKSNQFHKRTERAQTLMRGAVKNPVGSFQTKLQKAPNPYNIQRELRAKVTKKHPQVDHFGVPRPKPQTASNIHRPALSGELINRKPAAKAPAVPAPLPSLVTSVSHQKLERLLDEALTNADAHKNALRYEATRHFWHRRWLGGRQHLVIVCALILFLAGGFVLAWQKVPQLSVKVAGMRAHLSPAVPSYKPEGYALAGPAKAVQGAVTIKYAGKTADQSYDITQSPSNLNSTTVAQSVVPKGAPVQTSQVEGNTVYIYGPNNDAAWVNNGILYTIHDQADLNSDQIIKIVQGLNP